MADDSSAPDLPLRNVLAELQAKVAHATGGASPRVVLAEVARRLAMDLAIGYFDELPMHAFAGYVLRRPGLLGHLLPARSVRHRVLLGRYIRGSLSRLGGTPGGFIRMYARIGILGIGTDGGLRVGHWSGAVIVPSDRDERVLEALPWDDIRLRNVPPRGIVMRDWSGDPDPRQVASPAVVVEALGKLASKVAADSTRDLALLQRYLLSS